MALLARRAAMALLARRARRAATKAVSLGDSGVELAIPAHFRCPISLDLMKDPVTAPTGITYDRESIEAWLDTGHATCPVTHAPLRHEDLVPNHAIRRVIQDWCVANRSHGVERIPTPKIPVTPVQASELLFELAESARRGDAAVARCAEVVARVRELARDSERNRHCFASIGTGRALAAAFESLAAANGAPAGGILEDVLDALVSMVPLDEEAARILGSPCSLGSLIAIAEHGGLAGRMNAVMVIKEIVSWEGAFTDLTGKVDEVVDALVKVIRAPICPQATKASMVATYHLARFDERVASRLATAGLVPVLVEVLVDADKSMSEKALAVLEAVLASEEGRESARAHALAVPVLIKKMFRVSDLATELAVSAMWRLGRAPQDGEDNDAVTRCLVEALRVGAFQKLLLLLQVGCRDATKEKATELLKMLNKHKGVGECVDAVDFRGLNKIS
ncbi:U-box domain-containing protein 21-like [Phragmites australis]|uniref:U-box domain-containing protein 21-like n=1 Tax=Phragmites australis TaxID=29695 RepID=UPI002D79FA3D|nr:U-box domain-containing protein 21-like [Phragmites australis]